VNLPQLQLVFDAPAGVPQLQLVFDYHSARNQYAVAMTYQTTHHPPRMSEERRDDDEPAPPWPWQPPASGQAARAECQKLADLEPISR
jgi:hypothetical protein